MAARVQLLSRQGCHLCDAARRVVRSVCDPEGVAWEEVDIDTDPTLQARYGELIPVVLVDNVQVGYWHIEPAAIRAALR
jgi:glutaredoxin